jgi:hypothetical protein
MNSTFRNSRSSRLAILGVLLIVGAVVAWLLASRGDDKVATTAKPQLLEATAAQLSELAKQQGHEVYWAGPQANVRYEWTRTSQDRIYARYLKGNTKVGARNKVFLTIATYPLKGALKALQVQAAKAPASQTQTLPNGAFVYSNSSTAPNSAYVAFPGSDYEVEVYDPAPGKALAIAKSGKVQPIP